MLLAHGVAHKTIHACRPDAQVGLALAVRVFRPWNPASALDRAAAALLRYMVEDIWFHGTDDGRVRVPLAFNERNHVLAGSADFIGINYYSQDLVHFTANPVRLFGLSTHPEGAEFSDAGRRGVYSRYAPEGLYDILRQLRGFGKPIYITENGLPDRDDDQRPRWLLAHLQQVHRAIQDGADVRGYFHWTFTDNFEWSEGWGLRFGLVELDPATQERRPRPSAEMFGTIAMDNKISSDLVARYAPALLRP